MTAAARSSGAVIDLAFQLRRPSCGRAVKILAAGSQWTRRWREAGFEPSVPRGAIKVSRGDSSRLCSISCQRKSWRERQPIPRRRRAPSAGPIVRILFPPAKSLRTFRSLLESPRTPAVIVEAPVNGTDAASPLQRVAVPPDPRPQRVRRAAVPDRVGCCGARLCRKLPLSPSARRGRSLLAFACRAAARSNRRAGRGPPRDRHARARALKPLLPQSGGCRRKNTCSAATPGRSTRTASCARHLLGGIAIERVNRVWCSDVTYIPMAKGFLYLVVRVVTYSIDVETGI
jgi:hypothetical protein